MSTSDLANEWSLLQNQFDSYEKYSLVIKLFTVAIVCFSYFSDTINLYASVFFVLILWCQDSIWKTFQSRIEVRLLQLEKALADQLPIIAYQFNTEYMKIRPSNTGLILEYAKQAIRPTVAFPYAILVLALCF